MRYHATPVVFDMSLVYIVVALLTVLTNNLLVETFSLNSRINFGKYESNTNKSVIKESKNNFLGYIMSFVTLIFVVVCEVWWEAWGTATSYTVNLAAVAVVSVGCTGKKIYKISTCLLIMLFFIGSMACSQYFF